MGSQELSVSWKDHSSVLVAVFEKLLSNKSLVDCTVAAEGQYLRVHKVVLSACSPYFEVLLNEDTDKHPIIILRDVKFEDLKRIIDFVYRGEVKLPEDQLVEFLNVAESLQIKGLGAGSNEASGKRKFTEDLFSKKKVESSKPQKRSRNQLSDSENVVKESVPTTELGSQIDDSDPPWHQSNVPPAAQVPCTVESQPMPTNVFTTPSKTNTQDNFPSSEVKSDQVTVPPEPVLPSSSAVVKVEFSPDDSLGAKDDFTYETINEAFSEDSYVMDSENQAVQPSTSHQYSQLPPTHLPSGSLTADNSLAASQVVEQGHAEGFGSCVSEGTPREAYGTNRHRKHDEGKRISPRGDKGVPSEKDTVAADPICVDVDSYEEDESVNDLEIIESDWKTLLIDDSGLLKHLNIAKTDKSKVCPLCKEKCKDVVHLREHLRTHAGVNPFKCELCDETFTTFAKLKLHSNVHNSKNRHVCTMCNQTFSKLAILRNHLRVHSDEKPFQCDVCFRKFRHKTSLTPHMRIHTGEKPFKCALCPKTFRHNISLKLHTREHLDQ